MYLDYAASTPVKSEVKNKLIEVLDTFGNPSSLHNEGIAAKKLIKDASEIIGAKLGCKPAELHFTSGATMSNNLAIRGFMEETNGYIVTDYMEHDDIVSLAEQYINDSVFVFNQETGLINLKSLDNCLKNLRFKSDLPILVSIQMANSETGVIQDIKKISEIVHSYPEVYLHTDATQYIPYYPVNVNKLGIDMLSMSGQKIGCIKGTGLLYIKDGVPIKSIIMGDQGLIGGTENVCGITCLGEAFKCIDYDIRELKNKRDCLCSMLKGKLVTKADRLPNNIMMFFEGVNSEQMLALLNENEIYASGGSACSSYKGEPSQVLIAMGYSDEAASCCVRFTISNDITYEDIKHAAIVINNCYQILKD